MISSIIIDLGILGFFKYYNFVALNINDVFREQLLPVLNIVLPIGISFYTFHTISYIVDVAEGRVRPSRNLWEYLTYVCLFSQLVAGPIVRFRQIEADLDEIDRKLPVDYVARGVGFFAVGMVKKVIIADMLAYWIDPMLGDYHSMSTVGAWAAALGYAFQLYYDFSGYSDMAIGLGYLFGIRIPQNFNVPYQAVGIRDFWKRWHMSLSSCLRDYLYIPLGGNRHGVFRTGFNLLLTMFIGGLWHGAKWTFVVWGIYHGVLLVLDHVCEPLTVHLPALIYRWITFFCVIVGWVLFRATNFQMTLFWLRKMFCLHPEKGAQVNLSLIGAILLCFLASNLLRSSWNFQFKATGRWGVACAAALFVAYVFMNERESVFLYYQF